MKNILLVCLFLSLLWSCQESFEIEQISTTELDSRANALRKRRAFKDLYYEYNQSSRLDPCRKLRPKEYENLEMQYNLLYCNGDIWNTILADFEEKNVHITFGVDESLEFGEGAYYQYGEIFFNANKLKNDDCWGYTLFHELLHVVQHDVLGCSRVAKGMRNKEFEVAVALDFIRCFYYGISCSELESLKGNYVFYISALFSEAKENGQASYRREDLKKNFHLWIKNWNAYLDTNYDPDYEPVLLYYILDDLLKKK